MILWYYRHLVLTSVARNHPPLPAQSLALRA